MSSLRRRSSRVIRVSNSFSPWRVPMMFVPVSPNSCCTALARSPMVEASDFWMNKSPGFACSNANMTRSTASSRFIRKRVILGSVIVMGLPARIWSMNSGMTLPRLHMTLP